MFEHRNSDWLEQRSRTKQVSMKANKMKKMEEYKQLQNYDEYVHKS
jgi:hypothetical protein